MLVKTKRGKRMADKIIIPMKVLAYRIKEDIHHPSTSEEIDVPALNPNYKTAANVTLGADVSPEPFFSFTQLKKGLHLHFILPSGLKKGIQKENGNDFEYPLVPDKYIITRMYVDKSGKLINDCNIVDSSFYSKINYGNSITIPFENKDIRTYRYLGRQYSGFAPKPEYLENEGNITDLRAIGPGDPLFNAYYPNCQSVFGFYDSLDNVPTDAILTYSVIGYYSDPKKDPFYGVDSIKSMEKVLSELNLSIPDQNETIYKSCLLFGEVCNIKDNQSPAGDINIGIGKTSAEALSAVINQKYVNNPYSTITERNLTTIQYDMIDETSQIDGNFRIDDTIHSYGFSSTDPMEIEYNITYSKETKIDDLSKILDEYVNLSKQKNNYGKSRRLLEYKKNTLYYLWEMYIRYNTPSSGALPQKINDTIDEIKILRQDIDKQKEEIDNKHKELKNKLESNKANINEIAAKPFYFPKDPALILFGKGMNRTYVFGEDGDPENNNVLYCLTSPLSDELAQEDYDKILNQIPNKKFVSVADIEEYSKFLVMTVMLMHDAENNPSVDNGKKYPPVMLNTKPDEEALLFMEWKTEFCNDYEDCIYDKSSEFKYGQGDYIYNGAMTTKSSSCSGISVLTPHGVCNLQDKLNKYSQKYPKDEEINQLIKNIKDIPAISQNLGGFTISLASLAYVFQLPIPYTKDPKLASEILTNEVYNCLFPKEPRFNELDLERRSVILGQVLPLREGILNLSKLSIVSSFGQTRHLINDEGLFKGEKYFSENLSSKYLCTDEYLTEHEKCFLPLTLTTPARLSAHFISALNKNIPSCSLPGCSPIIAIIMPDLLNKNLNIYDNTGNLIGIIKTVYRVIDGQKTPVGRFVQASNAPKYDNRIDAFKDLLTKNENYSKGRSYLSELMDVIDKKLENTIPMDQSDFIFGRVLVLTEMNIELEYYGGTEFSKDINQIENLDDKGLSQKEFPVMIGDIYRVTDGVICGFYGGDDGFGNGFAAFGYEEKYKKSNKYLNAPHPKVSGETAATITLLLDPSQKVTLSTGILPVEQIQIDSCHTDFCNMNLMATEMNTLISETNQIQLPDFTRGEKFTREYPILENGITNKVHINVINAEPKIGTIGRTIITDGFIVKNNQ